MFARTYPADQAEACGRLFVRWLGSEYARSITLQSLSSEQGVSSLDLAIGRRWVLRATILDTLSPDAEFPWEAARAAVEQRLDALGRSIALWVPRGGMLPAGEPGLSELAAAVEGARPLDDGRLEVRRPIHLHLRRTDRQGSVMTAAGGLSSHWAYFTGKVAGSYQLNSLQLTRLPGSQEERDELFEKIVLAAAQPEVEDSITIEAEDAWTAVDLEEGGSCVLGTPKPDNDEWSASLRRNLRRMLRTAVDLPAPKADARALVILGASTYAAEEKLSLTLRGADPSLFAGYDILAVVTDGVVKPVLRPERAQLPWDA